MLARQALEPHFEPFIFFLTGTPGRGEMFRLSELSGASYSPLYLQITGWWYSVRTSASHSSASGHTGRSNGQSEVAAHACASMCDEMVTLWRLAVLDPALSPQR
jgi:hypothetical protein